MLPLCYVPPYIGEQQACRSGDRYRLRVWYNTDIRPNLPVAERLSPDFGCGRLLKECLEIEDGTDSGPVPDDTVDRRVVKKEPCLAYASPSR